MYFLTLWAKHCWGRSWLVCSVGRLCHFKSCFFSVYNRYLENFYTFFFSVGFISRISENLYIHWIFWRIYQPRVSQACTSSQSHQPFLVAIRLNAATESDQTLSWFVVFAGRICQYVYGKIQKVHKWMLFFVPQKYMFSIMFLQQLEDVQVVLRRSAGALHGNAARNSD